MEIKELTNITQENTNDQHSQSSEQISYQTPCNVPVSPPIYRYQDPNISAKRMPTTSFAAEYQKSLSIVDYIDLDVSDDNHDDDPLESVKYLFVNPLKLTQLGNTTRRIPRRPTNASSISTDSGYSDIPTSKLLPVHLISCSLIPVNVRCMACTCPVSSCSTTCLSNQSERQFPSHCCHPPISLVNRTENTSQYYCACQNKFHSTMTVYPSTISIAKIDDQNENFHEKKTLKKKRPTLFRFV